ncbi:hypothetical protein B0J14DRAFT_605341 [Halenospora varia]|nr:hypothetical protein B0J14DRAFT_605341 [Halenospora varia]
MPNLIERFCARSAIEGSRHFEVLWSGCARKTIFDAVKSTLFKRGWNILNTYEFPNLMDDMGYGGFYYRDPTAIHFTMKRREIIGTLYSTAPFSNGGSMDYFDGPEPWLDDPCYETNTNEYLTLEKDEEFAVLPDGRIEAITHVGNLTDTTCSTSFLDLPQEIRKQIYGYLVLAPKQLDIYYGTALTVENRSCKRYRKIAIGSIGWKSYKEHVENILHTQFLAADLMRSNSILATELAPIYYGKNTFHFVNNFTWNDAARWLQRIGPINRGHLTDLRMEIGVLAHVWQGKDGSRTVLPNNTYPGWNRREKVYDRNPHLIVDTECVEGMVENINPALETFFEVLGSTKGGKVTINVILDKQTVPGVQLLVDEKGHPVSRWCSMDLPNLMEKFRTIYTSRQGESREVDILWKGSEDKVAFNAGRQEVENAGWEIVNTNEEIKQSYGDKDIYPLQVYYTLRRKRIVGKIWAETFSLNSCRRGMREWNEANWLN